MRTLTLERNGRIYLTNVARVLPAEELPTEIASKNWGVGDTNPYIKWISGAFVRSDEPNSNKQFWTAGDLELAEYTIHGAPLNLVHRVRQPIGFFRDTEKVSLASDNASADPFQIDALAGMWTHLFPFESALVDAANEQGSLFYSMECQGTHLICAGDEGCGGKFDYLKPSTHCEHLKDRASIRHIVNPTFRGGALIVPPISPGWKEAKASVYEDLVLQEAAGYAEEMEDLYEAAGADLSPRVWEYMMATIVSLSR